MPVPLTVQSDGQREKKAVALSRSVREGRLHDDHEPSRLKQEVSLQRLVEAKRALKRKRASPALTKVADRGSPPYSNQITGSGLV